jgi:hypothetical protein
MPEIAKGVSFDKVAREWRCRWSTEAEKVRVPTQFVFAFFHISKEIA